MKSIFNLLSYPEDFLEFWQKYETLTEEQQQYIEKLIEDMVRSHEEQDN